MVFDWIPSDSKFPQVSRNLPNILADLNSAVIWMISNLPIFNSSNLFSRPLETVSSAPSNTGITVTMLHGFFLALWQDPSICRSFRFLLFSLDYKFFFFSWSINTRFDLLIGFGWSVCITESSTIFIHVIFFDRFWFVHIPFVIKFQSLKAFPDDHLSHLVVPSLVLLLHYFQHLLIMWLTVSCLPPHKLHLIFYCVLLLLLLLLLLLYSQQ